MQSNQRFKLIFGNFNPKNTFDLINPFIRKSLQGNFQLRCLLNEGFGLAEETPFALKQSKNIYFLIIKIIPVFVSYKYSFFKKFNCS